MLASPGFEDRSLGRVRQLHGRTVGQSLGRLRQDGGCRWSCQVVGGVPFHVRAGGGEAADRHIVSIQHRYEGAKAIMDIVKLTEAFQLEQPWDDLRAQFVGHPTIKPMCVDLSGKTGLKEKLRKPNLIRRPRPSTRGTS